MGKITTVLGDISPEELGYTTIHEHPFMRADSDGVLPLPEDATPEKTAFAVENLTYLKTSTCSWTLKEYLGNDDLELEIKELLEFKKTGGQALLNATYIGCRVNDYPNKIRELSRRSGIKIICGTGYYGDYTYSADFDPNDSKVIRQRLIAELTEGMEGSDLKAGYIKKGFGLSDEISAADMSVFRSICEVAAETDNPFVIHGPNTRESALEAVRIAVKEYGIKPERIDMCHMDFLYSTYCKYYPDAKAYFSDPTKAAASVADFASELLDMGVYVNFDGWGDIHGSRHKLNQGFDYCWGFDDFFRLAVVAKLLEKGYAEKIMFGHDKYNKLGGFYGGAYGYTRFPTFAIPALREMGYEKEAQLITVANPARFLSHS